MSRANNGGPAFPCMPPQDTAAGVAVGYPYPDAGMTLRDYFAAKALIGLMGFYGRIGHDSELLKPELADEAYETADAMLKARES